ncbi:MAG: DUF3877 family protein [Clostridia bacterium]|nr:DUF3877 family protein [Clostridia bacterium]
MDYSALERNIIEVMEEQQAKLGFDGETVNLFYPVDSVAMMLGVDSREQTLTEALKGFCAYAEEKLGEISCAIYDGRVSFAIPAKGGQYVSSRLKENSFIVRLVRLVASHRASIKQIIDLFKEYSDKVCVRKMPAHEEFDYLVFFSDGTPDSFWYCLKEEMGHVTYHRFTKADFEAFGFEIAEANQ